MIKKGNRILLSTICAASLLAGTMSLLALADRAQNLATKASQLAESSASLDNQLASLNAAGESLAVVKGELAAESSALAENTEAADYADQLIAYASKVKDVNAQETALGNAWNEYNYANGVYAADSANFAAESAAYESEQQSIAISMSESQSVSEAESISEAASIAESISVSESESEAARIFVGDMELVTTVPEGLTAPKLFTLVDDSETFGKRTDAFYSSDFGEYVYYATENGQNGFYVYDSTNECLFPFVSFTDGNGNSYMVIAPEKNQIPSTVTKESEVNLSSLSSGSGTVMVPGFEGEHTDGTDFVLIYLVTGKGEKGFYEVRVKDGGMTMLPYEEVEETETEETTEKETVEESTEEASDQKDRKGISGYVIWLIIIGIIIVLLIVAIIVVYRMNKKQEEEEDEVDYSADLRKATLLKNAPDTDYTQNAPASDSSEFDVTFEDAFPDEMGVKEAAPEAREEAPKVIHAKEEKVDTPLDVDMDFEQVDLLSDSEDASASSGQDIEDEEESDGDTESLKFF